jgi:large subunit ribosomal protein L25
MTDVLQVELRDELGSLATRRLRRSGKVPAVLYGHGEANKHLAISSGDVVNLLRHHSKTVSLTGAVIDTALVSDLQFDALGIEVLHMDLIRVNLAEKVEVTVPIHRQGDAAGVLNGGMYLENLHEVQIRCSAGSIPEFVVLKVADLQLGGHKYASDLTLPEGVELVTPGDMVVAHVEKPKVTADAAAAGAAEPAVAAKGAEKKADA